MLFLSISFIVLMIISLAWLAFYYVQRFRYVHAKDRLSVSNLLTPWSRVLLEKLIGFQLVKKFPAFYGTRKFITAFTSARHLSLSIKSEFRHTAS